MRHVPVACLALLVVASAGCGGTRSSSPLATPFTGATRRFYVDALALTTYQNGDMPLDASVYGDDLAGRGKPVNALGELTFTLELEHMYDAHAADAVAARAVDAAVEIVSDDPALADDASVGVRFFGDVGPASPLSHPVADQVAATLTHGHLVTDRLRAATKLPRATLVYPLFEAAAPSRLPVAGWQMTLDPDGAGGLSGVVQGVLDVDALFPSLLPGFRQALAAHPEKHPLFIWQLDTNGDGVLDDDELASNALLQLPGDVTLPATGTTPLFSFGAAIHLSPCPDDACTRPAPAPSCVDHVRNGAETDVDCGGGCGPCAPGLGCAADADCTTAHCDAGQCRRPTCSDGVADGFEIDVDCGPGCGPCTTGQHCLAQARQCAAGETCAVANPDDEIGTCM